MSDPTYRCPHCGTELDHVVVTQTIPLLTDNGYQRHPVDAARLAAVVSAHRHGGVTRVMSELGVSKSQAYRLLTQAQETNGEQP